jgi:Ca2+-transporting ATPase
MDGPPAISLGLEPIRGDLMAKKPTKRDSGIITLRMLERILINGLFIAAVFLTQQSTNFLGIYTGDANGYGSHMPTVLFAIFALFQLFNSMNSRELGDTSIFKHFLKNKPYLIIIVPTFIMQVLITQFGGAVFGTVPLPFVTWLKILALTSSIVVLAEAVKLGKFAYRRIKKLGVRS